MSGFAHLTGDPDGPPTLPAFGLADSICGIAASSAVDDGAAAHRERNGGTRPGHRPEPPRADHDRGRPGPDRLRPARHRRAAHGNRSTNNAPRNTYRTSDGHWVAISTSAQSHRRARHAPRRAPRGHRRAVVRHRRRARGARRPARRLRRRLDRASATATRCSRPSRRPAPRSRRSTARRTSSRTRTSGPTEMIIEVDDPDLGPVLMHNVMWRMSETPGRSGSPAARSAPTPTTILVDELGSRRASPSWRRASSTDGDPARQRES